MGRRRRSPRPCHAGQPAPAQAAVRSAVAALRTWEGVGMSSREDHLRWWRQMVRESVTRQAASAPITGAVDEPAINILRRFTDATAVGGTIKSGDGAFAFIAAKVSEQSGTTSLE